MANSATARTISEMAPITMPGVMLAFLNRKPVTLTSTVSPRKMPVRVTGVRPFIMAASTGRPVAMAARQMAKWTRVSGSVASWVMAAPWKWDGLKCRVSCP